MMYQGDAFRFNIKNSIALIFLFLPDMVRDFDLAVTEIGNEIGSLFC